MFTGIYEEADRQWTVLQIQTVLIAAWIASKCSEFGAELVKSVLELTWPFVKPLSERFERYCEQLFE